MKRLLVLGLLLGVVAPRAARAELIWPFSSLFQEQTPAAPASGGGLPPQRGWTRPHPAVVRVIVPETGGSTSYGSGTLVDVHDRYGLVITNYHVVCDASGPATVLFPDGFQSAAQVVKIDRDWDLAALAIWKPETAPVSISAQAAQPGEWLTIAGYGQGLYRAAAGQCTQYVAPGMRLPMETVEVGVAARQGDSGGPILNARGELAGVLWGAGGGRTAGSYCGRVRQFLASIIPTSPAQSDPSAIALAAAPPPSSRTLPVAEPAQPAFASAFDRRAIGQNDPAEPRNLGALPETEGRRLTPASPAGATVASPTTEDDERISFDWEDLAGNTRLEQAKALLAVVGIVALALQFRRFLVQHG